MPCDTQRTITTKLEAAHPDVLGRGLTAAGFAFTLLQDGTTIRITRDGREVARLSGKTLSGTSEAVFNDIKRAYATEAVKTAARKYGWAVKADAEQDSFTVMRRVI
jgi:hypothetical protein